ncbi:MAG TPA: IS5 family transposase [Candidatus Paceibacterota bacterium]
MVTTSKSPKAVALVAYATAKRSLPQYSHLKSPKKFTQHQLVACLVLKEFFRTDYRGIMEILQDSSDLQKVLELDEVPHYTTLQKAARRFTDKKTIDRLLRSTLALATTTKVMKKSIALSAIDSTGLESHYTSSYFVTRKAKGGEYHQTTHYTRFPKVGIVMDCASFLVLAGTPSWGPSPDIIHFKKALTNASRKTRIVRITADAGYDAEHAHVFAREVLHIKSIIPNRVGRPTKKLPSGKYRRLMALRFDKERYGQRWMVETLNSMFKKRLGSFLRARSYWSQMREIMLRLFTFNVLLLRY